eukprot:6438152-Ditylum_brightwellii.AAC.1
MVKEGSEKTALLGMTVLEENELGLDVVGNCGPDAQILVCVQAAALKTLMYSIEWKFAALMDLETGGIMDQRSM